MYIFKNTPIPSSSLGNRKNKKGLKVIHEKDGHERNLSDISIIVGQHRFEIEDAVGETRSCNMEKDKIRVQFDMGKKTVEKLDKMRDQIASPSRAHVVKIALALLETIMEEGGEKNLYLEKDGKKQHIVIPDLIINKK